MPLTLKEVEHVALLARLSLTETEKEKYTRQLSDILDYFEILKGQPTEGVEPLAHVLPIYNVMRDDIRRASLPKNEALANAPQAEEGLFKVPKIV